MAWNLIGIRAFVTPPTVDLFGIILSDLTQYWVLSH